MDAAYNDYINDVRMFLRALPTTKQLLGTNALGDLWARIIDGWKQGTPASQVALDWYKEADKVLDSILANRETRRQIWEAARLTGANYEHSSPPR